MSSLFSTQSEMSSEETPGVRARACRSFFFKGEETSRVTNVEKLIFYLEENAVKACKLTVFISETEEDAVRGVAVAEGW